MLPIPSGNTRIILTTILKGDSTDIHSDMLYTIFNCLEYHQASLQTFGSESATPFGRMIIRLVYPLSICTNPKPPKDSVMQAERFVPHGRWLVLRRSRN